MAIIKRFTKDESKRANVFKFIYGRSFLKLLPVHVWFDRQGWYEMEEPKYRYDVESGFWIPSF